MKDVPIENDLYKYLIRWLIHNKCMFLWKILDKWGSCLLEFGPFHFPKFSVEQKEKHFAYMHMKYPILIYSVANIWTNFDIFVASIHLKIMQTFCLQKNGPFYLSMSAATSLHPLGMDLKWQLKWIEEVAVGERIALWIRTPQVPGSRPGW